jgi:hypothetical protein
MNPMLNDEIEEKKSMKKEKKNTGQSELAFQIHNLSYETKITS